MFLFAKESGYTLSVSEIYIVDSGLTQLEMLAIFYRNYHLGLWQMFFFLLIHVCCASGVAGYVCYCFQISSGKAIPFACWHCLPPNVPEE